MDEEQHGCPPSQNISYLLEVQHLQLNNPSVIKTDPCCDISHVSLHLVILEENSYIVAEHPSLNGYCTVPANRYYNILLVIELTKLGE